MGSRKGTRSEAVRKGNRRRSPAARDIRAVNKVEVVRLRLEGNSYRAIGEKLDLSLGAVHELCTEALTELQGEGRELAKRLRAEQLQQLDEVGGRLLRLVLKKDLRVTETKPDGSVLELAEFETLTRLTGSLGKVWERQAKLMGLDAPAKVDIGGGVPISLPELAQRAGIHPTE
jgi:hypothetical protein